MGKLSISNPTTSHILKVSVTLKSRVSITFYPDFHIEDLKGTQKPEWGHKY
jgi:hypothetical protein